MCYLHNNSKMLIPKFQNKTDFASYIFVTNFTFVAFPNFSLKMEIFLYKRHFSLYTQNLSGSMFYTFLTDCLYKVRTKLEST